MREKFDPFDVDALERSLNDSATRVSTIWGTFLIFSLYILTAAATVEYRQLFLAEPVKLPVLNIELPLWGFFFLAPVLFIIFHTYVLLQVLLLARTAAAYNDAVEKTIKRESLTPTEEASLRQRLANTIFAQIFAGSPREREGWLGWLLKSMAWITLVISPALILAVFQVSFLPYHSHFVTWTHRLLIAMELAGAFVLWPLVLDARRDFKWGELLARLKLTVLVPVRIMISKDQRREWLWSRQQTFAGFLCFLFVVIPLFLLSFPGEPHVNLLTGHAWSSVQCERPLLNFAGFRFDRLIMPRISIVDSEKLEKIQKTTEKAGEQPYKGERTRILRDRDLNCGDFSDADLRRVDWTNSRLVKSNLRNTKLSGASLINAQLQGVSLNGADLQGASLEAAQLQLASLDGAGLEGASLNRAELQGASFNDARLSGASLDNAKLRGASLNRARLQGASLNGAELQGATLESAHLQGASLVNAKLQGASFDGAELQGVSLDFAQLQGASLDRATLWGASLSRAKLQGASLNDAELQGADLDHAQLDGASLDGAWLQGAALEKTSLTYTRLSDVYVWRANISGACSESRVNGHKADAILSVSAPRATWSSEIAAFIERSVADIPESRKEQARARMLAGLFQNLGADSETYWSNCESLSAEPSREKFDSKFDEMHVEFLRRLVCEDRVDGATVARGVIRNWIRTVPDRRHFSVQLARGLIDNNGGECAGMKDLGEAEKNMLRQLWVVPELEETVLAKPQVPRSQTTQ
jgi:uncharacterized protein YjbI with pentapeptide repeats